MLIYETQVMDEHRHWPWSPCTIIHVMILEWLELKDCTVLLEPFMKTTRGLTHIRNTRNNYIINNDICMTIK